MKTSLPILNADTATFDCSYGRGCDGICCQNGRPPVYEHEVQRIDGLLERALPLVSPAARKLIDKSGYLSRRTKAGAPMLRVVDTWCVFFNAGCVLHKLGQQDGKAYAYKPAACALFPLEQTEAGDWYVRQHNYRGEQWDLFCLNPNNTAKKASETLAEEIELALKGE